MLWQKKYDILLRNASPYKIAINKIKLQGYLYYKIPSTNKSILIFDTNINLSLHVLLPHYKMTTTNSLFQQSVCKQISLS